MLNLESTDITTAKTSALADAQTAYDDLLARMNRYMDDRIEALD